MSTRGQNTAPIDATEATGGKGAAVAITLNGAPREVRRGVTVAELVAELGLAPEQVAVELDRALLPRARHAATQLAGGEALEVVTLVGGG